MHMIDDTEYSPGGWECKLIWWVSLSTHLVSEAEHSLGGGDLIDETDYSPDGDIEYSPVNKAKCSRGGWGW